MELILCVKKLKLRSKQKNTQVVLSVSVFLATREILTLDVYR